MDRPVWFKHGDVCIRTYLAEGGKLGLMALASRFNLEPSSIMIEDICLHYNAATGECDNFAVILRQLRSEKEDNLLGSSREKAILIFGETTAGAAGVPGRRTERELLCQSLPRHSKYITSVALPKKIYPHQPAQVKLWKRLRPGDPSSPLLTDAIRARQESADNRKRRYSAMVDQEAPITNEASVEGALRYCAMQPLTSIAIAAGKSVAWFQQTHSSLDADVAAKALQAAAAPLKYSSTAADQAVDAAAAGALPACPAAGQGRSQGQTGLQQAEAAEEVVRTSSFGRPLRSPSYSLPDEPSSTTKVGLRHDLVLLSSPVAAAGAATGTAEAEATSHASSSTSTAMQQKYYSIVEVKGVHVLMENPHEQNPTPLDLHDAWQRNVPHIRSCLSQLYTYMYAEGICYGGISCYFGTWIVVCPSTDPGSMYLSECFLADTEHQATAPAATAMGALALLQDEALASTDTFVLRTPATSKQEGAGSPNSQSNDGPPSSPDAGGRVGSQEVWRPGLQEHSRQSGVQSKRSGTGSRQHGSNGIGSQQHRSSSGNKSQHLGSGNSSSRDQSKAVHTHKATGCCALPPLVLGSRLCPGSAGPVYEGKYRATPAIIKLIGPAEEAYWRERYMYQQMQPKQGELVPRLLAAGHVVAGVNFLAVERINGQPLSSLQSVPEIVGAAAVAALESLADAFPGFLHGDIRLQNVLLVAGSSDAAPRCMWIDFGQSSLDGVKQEQLAEVAKLKRLLRS